MEKFVNNNKTSKINEIIDFVKDSKEYQDYLFLFDKLSKNDRCNSLIKQVKTLQKELVKKQAHGHNINELEEKINKFHRQNEIGRSYSFNYSKKYKKHNNKNIFNPVLSILINIL